MDLQLTFFSNTCGTREFRINGIYAEAEDFGNSYDTSPETAPKFGCGNRSFRRIDSTEEVLNRYHITENEYNQICEDLEYGLSRGECSQCA